MVGRLVNEQLESVPPAYIWGNMLPILKSTDLNLINLEAALTNSFEEVPKTFNFKASPHKVRSLSEASIDVVNLANNHVLDYSEKGLLETLKTLDDAAIKHVGVGKNISEASKPVIIKRKGIRVGILSCTDNEPTWVATSNRPGTRYLSAKEFHLIKGDIEALRPQVDLLILSIHWGPNMKERPSKSFIAFAHDAINAGVDVFHGHSAHIFQGVEIYQKKIILYDTGDFIDDYYVDPFLRNDRSFFFIIEANQTGLLSLRLIPVLISNFQVNRATGSDAVESLERMKQLSREFQTQFSVEAQELVYWF
jgi:poly-gamma-glutamate synthesis protein (capsule biosynthesis protein)